MIRNKLIAVFVVFALLIGTLYCGSLLVTADSENLITGGEWVAGQYLPNNGAFETTGQTESAYRIAYNKKSA